MANTNAVPVFWRDQDDVLERPAHTWPRTECRQKKNTAGKFENHGKTFRLFAARPQLHPVTAADLATSNVIHESATITTSEMLANVGIAGPDGLDVPAPRHVVRRAQQKIRAYYDADVRDAKAPLPYGRRYASERTLVTAVP